MTTINKSRVLSAKTIVITGASSGAGRAAAIQFAKHGAKIVLAGRRMEALDEVKIECCELGAIALAVQTDVTSPQEVNELAQIANEFGGSIDVWVNNAGVLAAGQFEKTPVEVHDRVIQTNLMGYLHGAHAVMPYFKEQDYGILINNISVGGWFPVPYGVGYSASKFGIVGYSEALRGELAAFKNIHVCNVFPAFLDTPGIKHAANYTGRVLKPAPPVYDPMKVGKAMVDLSLHPRPSVTVGSVAHLLKAAHSLAPGISGAVTSKVIGTYLKHAPVVPETQGNLFVPSSFGTSIHGGWDAPPADSAIKKILTGAAIVAGLSAGIFYLLKRRQKG